ncbi:MAG: cobalamin biosynthesis protein [Nitrospirae bacterium]|nr:cobalamin biosynthesis protein [Nitrospirota bacterium]
MRQRKLWMWLLVVALMVPLGIVVPERFGASGAWGEWSSATLSQMLGYLPEGLSRHTGIWSAPIGDYDIAAGVTSPLVKSLSYMASGLIGAAIAGLIIYIISKAIYRSAAMREKRGK